MIHNDHLGTPQKMTDSTGTVVWSADYKPFGEATVTVSTITNNLRFPGQYFDAETGLHYNYYRDYNPALGRYPQADPVGVLPRGSRGGFNHLYAYVNNNPIRFTDPKGLQQSGDPGEPSVPNPPKPPLPQVPKCVKWVICKTGMGKLFCCDWEKTDCYDKCFSNHNPNVDPTGYQNCGLICASNYAGCIAGLGSLP
jgi:RHS repeat-associated protein